MEHKYFAAVYEDDMNDVLRKADVIATYDAVRELSLIHISEPTRRP